MDMFVIEGGTPLRGVAPISGSKNAALALLCASLLADGVTTFHNTPDLRDIRSMQFLLEQVGAKVERRGGSLLVDSRGFDTSHVAYDVMNRMRASMYAFGPMIARLGRANVSQPGGCNIGSRPIDLHLRGFEALGVEVEFERGYIRARHDGLKGARMNLRGAYGPSVGATCNVLMAAVLAKGRTVISGAAREPEVVELCRLLSAMGAEIRGVGTETLEIFGVKGLQPVEWTVAPDRIEAGTFAVAALATDGDVVLDGVDIAAMESTLAVLRDWGADLQELDERRLRVRRGDRAANNLHLVTEPFPGLATDIQPPLVVLLGLTPGLSTFRETIYPDRWMHIMELNRMGARMRRDGAMAYITGVRGYEGAAVMASDLRAGAALVVAALAAHGESQVRRIYHVERGYERLELKLAALGARIRRAEESPMADPGLEAIEGVEAESPAPKRS